jgi:ABC-type sugar transport system ATPase subunit
MSAGPLASGHRADQICAVDIRSISKRFPGVIAISNVNFDAWTGEVHALVGENGAGKSTLIKLITGAERPDSGSIELFGSRLEHDGAFLRRRAGVAAIYQELMIVPAMSAAANVFLDNPPRSGFVIRRPGMRKAFDELSQRLGLTIDPDALAGSLSIADRQMLEIMRALTTRCRVMIMDEPTATLGPKEREKLFGVIGDLKQAGTAVIYISHDLDEVLRLADRISVMRDSTMVATDRRSEWTKDRMVTAMVGSKPIAGTSARPRPAEVKAALSVKALTVPGYVAGIDFVVGQGEIFGIAGLVGSGRTEILRALAGLDKAATAEIEIDGIKRALPKSPREAIANGVVLVPEDRKAQGFIPLLSGRSNIALTDLWKVSTGGVVSTARSRDLAQTVAAPIGFQPGRLDRAVGTLSGGNQQKLVIGKWLHRPLKVLLLDEPTRGVDIGAKAEIYKSIRRLAESGLAVILVSSELEELIEQADRIAALSRGTFVATLRGSEASVERLLSLIFAVEEAA